MADTDYTKAPVCPYCAHEEGDAWELDFGPGCDHEITVSCGDCDKDYFCSRNVSVTYSTKPTGANEV